MKGYKNWRDISFKEDIGFKEDKMFIEKCFEKYHIMKRYARGLIDQKLSIQYDQVVVQSSGSGERVENAIINKADAERFFKRVDKILDDINLDEPLWRDILYYRYAKSPYKMRHKRIYIKLGYDERQYFREWKKAVSCFVSEAVNRNLQIM